METHKEGMIASRFEDMFLCLYPVDVLIIGHEFFLYHLTKKIIIKSCFSDNKKQVLQISATKISFKFFFNFLLNAFLAETSIY